MLTHCFGASVHGQLAGVLEAYGEGQHGRGQLLTSQQQEVGAERA